jgi:hypothetical protein
VASEWVVGWGCVSVEIVGVTSTTGSSRACTGTCRSAIAATAEHTEIGGDNFKTGALLAFFILPLARLNAAFEKEE